VTSLSNHSGSAPSDHSVSATPEACPTLTAEGRGGAAPGRADGGSWLAAVGSLWLAVLLLVLLAVAMACATVYEASRGTEQALAVFYKSWWFVGLQGLLAVNCLAGVVMRLPVRRRQFGFLLTHLSMLAALAGAFITWQWGVEGQVALRDGETTAFMRLNRDALLLEELAGGQVRSVDLASAGLGGLRAVELPRLEPLALDGVSVGVLRYVADAEEREEVIEDAEGGRPAVEASVSMAGSISRGWVFTEQPVAGGPAGVGFRRVGDEEELRRMLTTGPGAVPASPGKLRVELPGGQVEIPVEEAREAAVPLGETGRSIRVLRYLPHAKVGADRQLHNVSERPVNPAVEVEITGGQEPVRRTLFAKFPDFGSLHGMPADEQLEMVFVASAGSLPSAPIEVIAGPRGDLHARFTTADGESHVAAVGLGEVMDTPWAGVTLTVHRLGQRVLVRGSVAVVDPPRQDRNPAILLAIRSPDRPEPEQVWLSKYSARSFSSGAARFRLSYSDQRLPLGFTVGLDSFTIEQYPGTHRPRSFESRVVFADTDAGGERRKISMNHPAKYGGYTFYQSSYREDPHGGLTTYLGVSWDPGRPVVFAGYVGMMVGMVWVLAQRVADRRRIAKARAVGAGGHAAAVDGAVLQIADRGAKA